MIVGLLHPGEMGVTIGTALIENGHSVLWSSDGRSSATAARANAAGFTVCSGLEQLLSEAGAVFSICPPDQAVAVADAVSSYGFDGLYVDGNAIAPQTALAVAERFTDTSFVDGGLIGPPAVRAGTTRVYLSGKSAAVVANWFDGSRLEAIAVSDKPSDASALKMCYAAYTKGLTALLLNVRALADACDVTPSLLAEWQRSQPGVQERSETAEQATAKKAWRFEGEMLEIAKTFQSAGLPGDFHEGAAEIYRRMAPLKLSGGDLAAVLATLATPAVD